MATPARNTDGNPRSSRTRSSLPATVPYHRLYQYADREDLLLMLAGSIGAIVHGASMPVFFLFAGDITNGFGAGDMSGVLKVTTASGGREDGLTLELSKRQSNEHNVLYIHDAVHAQHTCKCVHECRYVRCRHAVLTWMLFSSLRFPMVFCLPCSIHCISCTSASLCS